MMNREPLLLVVAVGMTREYLSDRDEHIGQGVNLGRSEIDRLVGSRENYGHGVLPRFLKTIAEFATEGGRCGLLFCRCVRKESPIDQAEARRFGEHGVPGTSGAEFGEPFRTLAAGAVLLETDAGSPTVDELRTALRPWAGKPDVTCLVVGSRTEIEVLQTASRLRHDLGEPRVLVCPHLTGSRDAHARLAALRGGLPDALVTLAPDLPAVLAEFGLPCDFGLERAIGCRIEPPGLLDALSRELREAYRTMFSQLFPLHDTVLLKPLSGGYSGCGLFLATSEREGARDAVAIVKVGSRSLIERELIGYHQMKGRLGPHVPTIQFPVREGALSGIAMEFASMSGNPETLQHCFEAIRDQSGFQRFFSRLDTTLRLLRKSLYGNRLQRLPIHPYFEFGLQSKQQELWLEANIKAIVPGYHPDDEHVELGHGVVLSNPLPRFVALSHHSDRVKTGIALCHGDLNFANIIFDSHDNLWLIDCSYSSERPVETDFAKLENDLTFVLVKEFTEADLSQATLFLRFCAERFELPPVGEVPDQLLFIATDSRYERIYRSIRLIRQAFLAVPHIGDELVYRIAQLKYAIHTLSFDQRRNRGECSLVQLKMALVATSALLDWLDRHPFHRQCAKDRPDDYPERVALAREQAPWKIPFPGYEPPEAETADVRAQDPGRNPSGKADPSDLRRIPDLAKRESMAGSLTFDTQGRPLHPRGRTGLAGRGFFWKWGPNLAVDPVVTRINQQDGHVQFLLVKRRDSLQWGIPGGMVRDGETATTAARRSLLEKTGVDAGSANIREITRGIMDDYRNTDHAWVETIAFHLHLPAGPATVPRECKPNDLIVDAAWMSITPGLVRFLFANHAWLIREALERMVLEPPADSTSETIRALLQTL